MRLPRKLEEHSLNEQHQITFCSAAAATAAGSVVQGTTAAVWATWYLVKAAWFGGG